MFATVELAGVKVLLKSAVNGVGAVEKVLLDGA